MCWFLHNWCEIENSEVLLVSGGDLKYIRDKIDKYLYLVEYDEICSSCGKTRKCKKFIDTYRQREILNKISKKNI